MAATSQNTRIIISPPPTSHVAAAIVPPDRVTRSISAAAARYSGMKFKTSIGSCGVERAGRKIEACSVTDFEAHGRVDNRPPRVLHVRLGYIDPDHLTAFADPLRYSPGETACPTAQIENARARLDGCEVEKWLCEHAAPPAHNEFVTGGIGRGEVRTQGASPAWLPSRIIITSLASPDAKQRKPRPRAQILAANDLYSTR